MRIGWWFCLFFTYKLHSNFKARTTRSAQINRLKNFTTANTKYWTADCEWVCVYFCVSEIFGCCCYFGFDTFINFFNCVFVLFFARFLHLISFTRIEVVVIDFDSKQCAQTVLNLNSKCSLQQSHNGKWFQQNL